MKLQLAVQARDARVGDSILRGPALLETITLVRARADGDDDLHFWFGDLNADDLGLPDRWCDFALPSTTVIVVLRDV